MAEEYEYDIVVVGAGMIGSAIAKYLVKENSGLRVALIGSSEEKDRSSTDIHGAFYDEGRITRVLDPDSIWATLGERSIHRYRDIEEESGIKFYVECGFLSVGTKDSQYLRNILTHAEALSHEVKQLSHSQLVEGYPYMSFEQADEGVLSPRNSGYINPRPLVKAQIKLAEQNGCHILHTVVDQISENKCNGHLVKMADGRKLTTRRVILATGGFTFCRSLMPGGIDPNLHLHPNTVILVELDEDERAIVANMPSMSYRGGRHNEKMQSCSSYILPPIQYPDGKYYLKTGMHVTSSSNIKSLTSPAELHTWYCHGRSEEREQQLINIVRCLFPSLKMANYHFDYCATARTQHNHPYVSMLTPSLGVAIGGCGLAAKSSDEIGLMAARMISRGAWNHDLPEEQFKFVEKTK